MLSSGKAVNASFRRSYFAGSEIPDNSSCRIGPIITTCKSATSRRNSFSITDSFSERAFLLKATDHIDVSTRTFMRDFFLFCNRTTHRSQWSRTGKSTLQLGVSAQTHEAQGRPSLFSSSFLPRATLYPTVFHRHQRSHALKTPPHLPISPYSIGFREKISLQRNFAPNSSLSPFISWDILFYMRAPHTNKGKFLIIIT